MLFVVRFALCNKFPVETSVTNKNKKRATRRGRREAEQTEKTLPTLTSGRKKGRKLHLLLAGEFADLRLHRSTVQELFFQTIRIYAYICLIDENPFSKHLWRTKVAHCYRPSRHAIALSSDSFSCVSNVSRNISMLFIRNVPPDNNVIRNVQIEINFFVFHLVLCNFILEIKNTEKATCFLLFKDLNSTFVI